VNQGLSHRGKVSEVLVTRPGQGDVRSCLDFMGARELVRAKTVLIKPNLTVNLPAETGVTTHPRLFAEAARYLIDAGAEVILGEGCATRVRPAFEDLGFLGIAEELGVRAVDFWDDEAVEVKVPEPLAVESFRIARTVLEADLILNIPVMKIHGGESKVTLCAKNMMGCISGDKAFMHRDFDAKIIDLLKVVRPDMNIIDGIVGMERQEIHGRSVGANLLVAGDDFVAVDSVSTWLMGFEPGEVPHIALAERYGFGNAEPSAIRIQGLRPERVSRSFARAIV